MNTRRVELDTEAASSGLNMKLIIVLMMICGTVVHASEDYAAWAKQNVDGEWTVAAEKAVAASSLGAEEPSDIAKFCPAYVNKNRQERDVFWVGLVSIVARLESGFKPETSFTESFVDGRGNKVISRGLLQISVESANQQKYGCRIEKAEDLHDPATNLACGVRILEAWVNTDHIVATYRSSPPRGGGRYWSTLRESNGHLPEITKFTKKLAACRAT